MVFCTVRPKVGGERLSADIILAGRNSLDQRFPTMSNQMCNLSIALLAVAGFLSPVSAGIIYTPDPTTGSYNTIPDFEFNQPTGPIPNGGYTGAGGIFLAQPSGGLASAAVVAGGAVGNGGQITIDAGFNGPGTALIWDSVMSVSAGQSYVISAFAKISPGTTSNVYIDLWDVSGDLDIYFDKSFTSGWQFAYETFTAPSDMVIGARAILDLNASTGDSVIFDGFAVTPLDSFVAPSISAVPEPETYAVVVGVALVGLGAWRRCRR
jgi:hypothetical protein